MKATLDKTGYITIQAETVSEGFALKYIFKLNEEPLHCPTCARASGFDKFVISTDPDNDREQE